ncbi:MAG: hypothetical protein QXI16_04555, partial [Sulfolobaceae archaeon]
KLLDKLQEEAKGMGYLELKDFLMGFFSDMSSDEVFDFLSSILTEEEISEFCYRHRFVGGK